MMYPFLTLDDQTEFVYSERFADGTMKIYIEKPDPIDGFHSASCILPQCRWENVCGFTNEEITTFQQIIKTNLYRISNEDFAILSIKPIQKEIEYLQHKYNIKHVDVFGSYADGHATEKSDLDLLVEFESTSVSLITLNKLKLELEEALGIRVDVVHAPIPNESILQIRNVLRII